MIYRIDVRIETPVRDTEVEARVRDAVRNLFPEADLESRGDRLVAETHSLDRFAERLREQEILDTARRAFDRRGDGGFSFALKKQAAFKGVVNFAVGEPDELGDIAVEVTVHEPGVGAVIDHVAPPTEGGEPVPPGER